jgi:hypothetical protein
MTTGKVIEQLKCISYAQIFFKAQKFNKKGKQTI